MMVFKVSGCVGSIGEGLRGLKPIDYVAVVFCVSFVVLSFPMCCLTSCGLPVFGRGNYELPCLVFDD